MDMDELINRADALGADKAPPGEKGADAGADPGTDSKQQPGNDTELIPLEGRICLQVATAAALIGKVFPSVRKVLNDEACEEVGNELAPLARKWNMDGPIKAFKYEAEVRALLVVAPLGFALYQAIREDWAVMNAEPVPGDDTKTGQPAPPPPPSKPSGMIQPE